MDSSLHYDTSALQTRRGMHQRFSRKRELFFPKIGAPSIPTPKRPGISWAPGRHRGRSSHSHAGRPKAARPECWCSSLQAPKFKENPKRFKSRRPGARLGLRLPTLAPTTKAASVITIGDSVSISGYRHKISHSKDVVDVVVRLEASY